VKSLWTLGGSHDQGPKKNLDKLTQTSVLCYRQTRRSLRTCSEQRLVTVFVAQEASFVFKITNNAG